MNNSENQEAVIGQKYAFATASLLVGIASFISLLGLEKSILAIIFGVLALRRLPAPALTLRRSWGTIGITLGGLHLLVLIGVLIFAWPFLFALISYVSDIGNVVARGPRIALSVPSPDGRYTAYVEESPSFDPPNQALLVERKDQRRFMRIAHLAEDVDSIRQIYWSPDSHIVVFHSRDYLTATRILDWETTRVFLGREWFRSKPQRQSTYSSGGEGLRVDSIEFPEAEVVTYTIEGSAEKHEIRFGNLSPRPNDRG